MSPSAKELHRMISEALQASAGDLRSLADEVGVSYESLWAWKVGRRTPSPANLRKLAAALRKRGVILQDLADDLDRAATED